MSYTDQIKSVEKRMTSFEQALLEMKKDQKEGFEKLSKEIEGLKVGIHGNVEHDQVGYRQRISELEEDVDDLTDFKKKIVTIVSLIAGLASVLINLLIHFFDKFL